MWKLTVVELRDEKTAESMFPNTRNPPPHANYLSTLKLTDKGTFSNILRWQNVKFLSSCLRFQGKKEENSQNIRLQISQFQGLVLRWRNWK